MGLALFLLGQTWVAEDAIQPKAAIAPDGTVVVVMIRQGKIQVAASHDGGKTFDAPRTAMDAQGKARGGSDRGPRIGVDAKGTLVVSAPLEMGGTVPDLWLVRSSDGGGSWSTPVRVNEVPKKAAEGLHAMTVASDGTVHVAWLDFREGNTNCLWYARLRGEKPGKNVKLTGAVCECCAPGLAVDEKGNPTIVVREGRKRDRGILLLRSGNGGASFSSPARVTSSPSGVDN